jgi:hypothetical protein
MYQLDTLSIPDWKTKHQITQQFCVCGPQMSLSYIRVLKSRQSNASCSQSYNSKKCSGTHTPSRDRETFWPRGAVTFHYFPSLKWSIVRSELKQEISSPHKKALWVHLFCWKSFHWLSKMKMMYRKNARRGTQGRRHFPLGGVRSLKMRRLTLFSQLFAIELLSRLSSDVSELLARRNANVAAGIVILSKYINCNLHEHSGGNVQLPQQSKFLSTPSTE